MRAGDIVMFTDPTQPGIDKTKVARILSWNGRPDSHVYLMDTRLTCHRRYADVLSLDVPLDTAINARAKIEGHLEHVRLKKKRTKQPAKASVEVDRGRGVADPQDIPLQPFAGASSNPTNDLWLYLLRGGAERRQLEAMRLRSPRRQAMHLRVLYPSMDLADFAALKEATR